MNPTTLRSGARASIGLAVLATALLGSGGPAVAQYGFGFGNGYGWGGGFYNQNAYSDVNYINSRSLINGAAAAANRPDNLTAPMFQSRDDTFNEKYDLATRASMVERIARNPDRELGTIDPTGRLERGGSRPSASTSTASTTKAAPPPFPNTVNLAAYFNKDHQLIWPSVAPISGDFGKKQAEADLAALAVLNEYELRGLAQLSTVTDARRKLLDYGRPALQHVMETSTPALADTFHVFLLSIYGNLGNAATVPKAP